MIAIVLDASALVKLILQEKGWEKIPVTVDTATLDYAIVESLNAIWKAIVQRRINENQGWKKLEALRHFAEGLVLFEAGDYMESGFEIALKERITVYDALYIALAKDLGAVLYTADKIQFEAARKYVRATLVHRVPLKCRRSDDFKERTIWALFCTSSDA